MGTYQYYEFQAIDRPLTRDEQEEVASLSSRVDPHPRQAVFVYHYGDFRGDELDILARYYDAFFYIANWGTTQLVFRLPVDVVDVELLKKYEADEFVVVHERGKFVLVEFKINDEDGYGWTEGDGILSTLIGLRDGLLNQDYRVMYLGWLLGVASGWLYEELQEPPVPAGLSKLNAPLESFVETFEVGQHLITAAAQASNTRRTHNQASWAKAIDKLSAAEQRAWLIRLAKGEPLLSNRFQKQLAKSTSVSGEEMTDRRTVTELLTLAQEVRVSAEKQAREQAEAARIQRLEALAPKAEEKWVWVEQLIGKQTGRSYDEAYEELKQLKELAAYQNRTSEFRKRLDALQIRYSRSSALQRRLSKL